MAMLLGKRRETETQTEPQGPDSPELADLPGFSRPPEMPGPLHPDKPGPGMTAGPPPDGAATSKSDGTGTFTPAFFKQRAASYAKIAEALLQAAGGWLNKASGEEESGAFLPDDDDAEMIPPPLGRLAARRIKLGDPSKLTDIEDIGMAAVGAAVWLAKGVTAMLSARRERRRLEAGRAMHEETGDGQ